MANKVKEFYGKAKDKYKKVKNSFKQEDEDITIGDVFNVRYNRAIAALSSGRKVNSEGRRGRKLSKYERGRAFGYIEGYKERDKMFSIQLKKQNKK